MQQTLELVDEKKAEYARQFSEAVEAGECTATNETEEGTLTFESLQATVDKFHEEHPKPTKLSEMKIEIKAKCSKAMQESIDKITRTLFMFPRRVVPRVTRTEITRLTERTRRELYEGIQEYPEGVQERLRGVASAYLSMRATCMPSRSRIIDGLRSRVEGMTGIVGRY